MNNTGKATSTRTTSPDKIAVRCANCDTRYDVDALDPEMRCPKCNSSEWVSDAPNSGERNQIPMPPQSQQQSQPQPPEAQPQP